MHMTNPSCHVSTKDAAGSTATLSDRYQRLRRRVARFFTSRAVALRVAFFASVTFALFCLLASVPTRAASPTYQLLEKIGRNSVSGKPDAPGLAAAVKSIDPSTYLLRKQGRNSLAGTQQTRWPQEAEPNDTFAAANALAGTSGLIQGDIFGNGDVDFYSITAAAGDRIYAAVYTSDSSSGSVDSVLQLLASDGTTVIEQDLDDGSLGSTSSSIAGTTLPTAGTYFFRVTHQSATSQLRPYRLYYQLRSGAPVAETEPNDAFPGQALPASGWVSGAISATTDVDFYSISLNAGDTVFMSLDLDPNRGGVATWSGRLGLGTFGVPPQVLVVNDANVGPLNSEAFFMTVKDAGTYAVFVDNAGGATFGAYHLSVTVLPKPSNGGVCTTYTSTNVPTTIPTGPGIVTSTLTIPGNPVIDTITVGVDLTHNFMADLDVQLTSPEGSTVGLFSDIGSASVGVQTAMNVVFDDDAAIVPSFTVVNGMRLQPELAYRLGWWRGVSAGGTWTLTMRDDATGDGGTLNNWNVTICEPPPPPVCAVGFVPTTVFSTDFESGAAGFTHSGTQDEWALGTPSAAPIASCASGTNCFKTDLTGGYNASSNQDLLSPNINLAGLQAPIIVRWSQKYQMETASFDGYSVEARQVGTPSNNVRLFEHTGATMTDTVGNPTVTIQEAAGWGQMLARADSLAGQNIELRFNVNSDTTVQMSGAAIDDVSVTACMPATADLSVTKVDTPDPVTAGNVLAYTVTVANAGPAAAANVSMADTLPTGTTFASLASPGGWTCTTPAVGAGGTVTCTNPSFAIGSAVFTLNVNILPSVASATVISNTATVTSSTTDPAPGNESATATTTVATAADIGIAVTDTPDPVVAGSNVTYTATVTNAGPSDAQAVSVSLPLPAVATFVSATAVGASCTTPAVGATGTITCTWPGGTAPATNQVLTVVATVDPFATVSMTTTVTTSSTTTDPTPANNSAIVPTAITTLTHTVTPSAGANGTIVLNTPVVVNHGGTVAFTVTPAMGYIAVVTGCGGTLVGNTYTTGPILADCAVTATFALDVFTVTVTSPPGLGTVTPSGPQSAASGSSLVFSIVPVPGFTAQATGCGGTLVGTVYTTGPITADCTIVVIYSTAAVAPVPTLPAGMLIVLSLMLAGLARATLLRRKPQA